MTATCLPPALGQIERQRLQLDRQVDVLQTHLAAHAQTRRREVEHGLDAGRHELIGDRLRGLGRHRHDRHLDAPGLELAGHVAGVDTIGTPVHLAARLGRVVVDDDGDAEALTAEPLVVEQRRAEIAEARPGPPPTRGRVPGCAAARP